MLLRWTWFLVISLLVSPFGLNLWAEEPSAEALERVRKLRMTHAGVDRQGHLWAWNRNSRSLRVVAPEGDIVLVREIDGEFPTLAVFDSEWGIAALDVSRILIVESPVGGEVARIPLPEDVRDVAWIGPHRVALSPAKAGHRVEIWDVARQERVATWGEAEPVPEGPGLHRVRHVYLAWEGEREELWTLESFTGEVVVFDSKGQVVLSGVLGNDDQDRLNDWMKKQDAELKARGESQEHAFNTWSAPQLTHGSVALVQECAQDPVRRVLLILGPAGDRDEVSMGSNECCGQEVLRWGSHWIFYRSALDPGKPCFEAVPTETSEGDLNE